MNKLASLLLVAAAVLLGCSEASHCPNCLVSSGGGPPTFGGNAGAGGGVTSFAGVNQGGGGPSYFDCGQLSVGPLQRWSELDLTLTLDMVFGEAGVNVPPEYRELARAGEPRDISQAWLERFAPLALAHAELVEPDSTQLEVCPTEQSDRRGCVDVWIRNYGLRLYRRPLSDAQVEGYVAQFVDKSSQRSPLEAARNVLLSMMLSPYFVFRIEQGQSAIALKSALPPGNGAPPGGGAPLPPQVDQAVPLTPFEVAARLSHFATHRSPDDLLLDKAVSGELVTAESVLSELERLQATPAGQRARAQQYLEWLRLESFSASSVDGDEQLATDMLEQTSLFIADVMSGPSPTLTSLLGLAEQPLNRRLAQHYGIDVELGDAFETVELEPTLYAGLLGQGALLTRWPRPVPRGLMVLEELLCLEFPEPPNTPIPGLDQAEGNTPREQITSLTQQPVCRACHEQLNPAGFALEAFDDRGRLTGFDTSGEVIFGFNGEGLPVAHPAELGQAIASSQQGRTCSARRHLELLLDRKLDAQGIETSWLQCLLQRLPGDLDLQQLSRELVLSNAGRSLTRSYDYIMPTVVDASSRAVDPTVHAAEEALALSAAFQSATDRDQLTRYRAALQALQALQPFP